MSDEPNLTPDEAADALADLLARDREIDDIRRQIVVAKATCDDLKAQLKDAQEARDGLSREIRNKSMPLFDRPPAGRGVTFDDDVAEGVRAAEARREGEWDLDGAPISPEAMPKLTGPGPKRGRKVAAQA